MNSHLKKLLATFSRALWRVAVSTILIVSVSANAQEYPTRPIRVISPYPAGSASDTVTRVVVDQVSQLIGQPMVIEARPAAGGSVGFAFVSRSDPHVYTLLSTTSPSATQTALH